MATIWTANDRLRAQAELQWRMCAQDKLYFFRNFWRIYYPKQIKLYDPRDPQLHAHEVWGSGGNSITLKARQIGWSTGIAADTFWEAFFQPEYRAMLMSKGEREAVNLLSMFKYGYRFLPQWLKGRGPELLDNNQTTMTFSSGSIVRSLPSNNDPARGFTGDRLIIDEFGQLPNPEEAWAAAKPVTDIGGQLILLGTASGYGTLFHRQWVAAELGESSFTPMFYGWWAVPERDQAWYEVQKQEMQEWQLHQEYPSDPDEAFVKSGNMVFDDRTIKQMTPETPKRTGDMVAGQFVDQAGGPLAIWEPPEPGQDYVMGIDTAEGLGHGDYSSCDVITPEGVQVAQWHGHTDPDLFGRICVDLGKWYNTALAVPEANSIGLATITTMRNEGYGRIWRRQQVNSASNGFTQQLGFHTSRVTKPKLVADLAEALREGMVIRSKRTVDELRTYIRDEKGHTSGSPHDDTVMSLGLANHGRPFLYVEEYKPEQTVARGTWDWHMERLAAQGRASSRAGRRIGAWNEKAHSQ